MTSKRDRERWLQTEIGGSTSLSLSLMFVSCRGRGIQLNGSTRNPLI